MGAGYKVRCKKCDDIIQSMYRHDFKWCRGKHIFVDGGDAYLHMGGNPDDAEILLEETTKAKKDVPTVARRPKTTNTRRSNTRPKSR